MSFISANLFGFGYLLAAFTYKSGTAGLSGYTHERCWPLWVMVVAFVTIGFGTTCMYISAMTTCVKNFGKGNNKGLAVAAPTAAFGLSGMWQSQLGEKVLYERRPDGKRGDVDVFKFFLVLAIILAVVGVLGTFFLKIVDEEELIDEAVDELERSGLLQDDAFFRRGSWERHYGTIEDVSNDEAAELRRTADANALMEKRKKTLLLNEETRRFLKDRNMWFLATGFFFVSGPGEVFITNLGTIIGTLYPPTSDPSVIPTSAATHVSIVAVASTISRLAFGWLSDHLAPPSLGHHYQSAANSLSSLPPKKRCSVSRIILLLISAALFIPGQALLASGFINNHGERFWIVSALIGTGYGALYSLTPLIITVIWGVENFGTNWGIVAMVPAAGATVWGTVYSMVYQSGAENSAVSHEGVEELLCYGKQCYAITFWGMASSVLVGCGFWILAWKGRDGWSKRGIPV